MINKLQSAFNILSLCIAISFSGYGQDVENLKLKDYRPQSIYKMPTSNIKRAKYPVIDVHAHDYAKTPEELDIWVKKMDSLGIAKIIILTGRSGDAFRELVNRYSRYPSRFDLWCGFDYTGYDQPGWSERAVAELEKCKEMGAKGVGEISDKGRGLRFSNTDPSKAMHFDDPRMKPLLKRCGELGMPINVHVADPYWSYLPMDSTNDGLMNAYRWRIDLTREGIFNHGQLIQTLENAVRDNPNTTFIACHLANCDFDLSILGSLLDKYPNLYSDISARFYETSTIPRHARAFFEKYSNRLLFGTDMGTDPKMYRFTFRVVESSDDHFYYRYSYHWPLYGLGLSDKTLKRLYYQNAGRILKIKAPKL
jgi:predicted TIM-barrel fold metal-dependent hydrolase